MAIGQGGRHESFKWGRAALTATNDEIVTLVTLGWEIGRVVESGDPLDEAMEKAVADYKATMSQLDKADLMASLVVSKIMQGEPYTLATERDFEGRLQSHCRPCRGDDGNLVARPGRTDHRAHRRPYPGV